jgi:hypothetical protein
MARYVLMRLEVAVHVGCNVSNLPASPLLVLTFEPELLGAGDGCQIGS